MQKGASFRKTLPTVSMPGAISARPALLVEPLVQPNRCGVSGLFADRLSNLCPDRHLVCPVARGHERASEGTPVDPIAHLHESARPEELDRGGPHDVRPASLGRLFCKTAVKPMSIDIVIVCRASLTLSGLQ